METDVNRRTKADKARALVDRIAKKRNAPWPLKFARAFKRPIQACVSGLSWVRSGGRIGLAPIYSFTFGEDQRAAKAPLQTFASGVDRLQNKLSRLASVQLMQFEVLPIAVNVTTRRRAKMLRWLFGFDAVLWGSYVSTEPPQIAIQIETAFGSTVFAGFFPCLAFTALTFVAGRVAGFGSGLRFAGSAATLVTRVASDFRSDTGFGSRQDRHSEFVRSEWGVRFVVRSCFGFF